MAKEGMKRPDSNDKKTKNDCNTVSDNKGKGKSGHEDITTIVD